MLSISIFSLERLVLLCLLPALHAQPVISAVVHAATFAPGPVAPGEVVVIGGTNLGPMILVSAAPRVGTPMPTSLDGTQVFFDGQPAPLLYASDRQVSAIAPFALDGRAETMVAVEYLGVTSHPWKLAVVPAQPGLFSSIGRQAAAINQDGSLNDAAHPASLGSVVSFYGTGAGQTTPPGVDGFVASGEALSQPLQPLAAMLGGVPVSVAYVGVAPELASGIFQMNLAMANSAGSGLVPVNVTSPGVTSPTTTVAVIPSSPVELAGITVSPQQASGGTIVSITATLAGQVAPPEGVWIGLASNDARLDLPPAIFAPPGERLATLQVPVPVVPSSVDILVAGALFQQTQSRQVRVLPQPPPARVTGISTQPNSAGVEITVTIASPAPMGGVAVALSSSGTGLVLPPTITIPAGSTVGRATVAYSSGVPATGASISAAAGTTSVQTTLQQAIPGWVDDSRTDALRSGPNLNSVAVTVANEVAALRARFVPGSYSADAVTVISIDTDRNPKTGWQGNYPDNSDPGLIGTDIVIATGGACYGNKAHVFRYDAARQLLKLVRAFEVVSSSGDGFDLQIPTSWIGASDFHFRAQTWRNPASCGYSGTADSAPDLGARPGRSAVAASPSTLAAPSVAASSGPIATGSSTNLEWAQVPGASFYLLAVEQTQSGQPWMLRKLTDSSLSIAYDGQGPAHWRVWPIADNGQAGPSSDWH